MWDTVYYVVLSLYFSTKCLPLKDFTQKSVSVTMDLLSFNTNHPRVAPMKYRWVMKVLQLKVSWLSRKRQPGFPFRWQFYHDDNSIFDILLHGVDSRVTYETNKVKSRYFNLMSPLYVSTHPYLGITAKVHNMTIMTSTICIRYINRMIGNLRRAHGVKTCIKRSSLGQVKSWLIRQVSFKKLTYETGVILKEVQFLWNFVWRDREKLLLYV